MADDGVMRAYTIRLKDTMVEAFDAKARDEGKTRSEVLRQLMMQYIEADTSDTDETRRTDVERVLYEQIEMLKEQNQTLRDGIVRVHDQLSQAQAVAFTQAQAIQNSTKLLEDGSRRRWWQFWK